MRQVKDQVYYLGIRDWEIREFHGHELSVFHGTTYNSYVIKDEKTVLVDTAWGPFAEDFLNMLDKEVGIDSIDYIVINHAEPDHSGSLPRIMERKTDIPIICSPKGEEIIKRHYHKDWNFITVKTGDALNIGKIDLVFVEMAMIHWPDSMMTFAKGPNVLLSNDAFGQHYCGASIFEDEVDGCEVWKQALKYYACILTPFSPLIKKKIEEVVKMNLPIEAIAPSHGVIWRKDPFRIVEKYAQWADNYDEGTVTIVYDTMYNATRKMADAIAAGLGNMGVLCKLYNSAASDMSEIMTDIFRSKGIIVGSCTVNNGPLRSIAALLSEMKGLRFKNKVGAAFGSYGWSGEAPKIIHEGLEKAGINVVMDPVSSQYQPEAEALDACFRFGQKFAAYIK